MSVNEEAKKLVEHLKADAASDDLMYESYVRQKIQAGLKAADEGRMVSHEEVKKRFGVS